LERGQERGHCTFGDLAIAELRVGVLLPGLALFEVVLRDFASGALLP
jgi:hypothetical protein